MNRVKRIISIFCFSSISFIFLNTSFAITGIVNTPAVRIREKASTDSQIITNAYENDELEILEEEGDWYKVKFNGKTGYASKSLVKTNSSNSKNKEANLSKDNEKNTEKKDENTNTSADDTVSTYNTETENNIQISAKNVINKDTSLKLLPNFSSNELKVLTKDTEVKIEKELINWVKISIADNSIGWVLKNNITYGVVSKEEEKEEEKEIEEPKEENSTKNEIDKNASMDENKSEEKDIKGKVSVETANVREKADKTSEIVGKLDQGSEVTIVEEIGDWYKITNSKIKTGYISKSLVSTSNSDVSSRSLLEVREESVIENKNELEKQNDNVVGNSISNNSKNGDSVVEFAKQYLGKPYVSGGKTPETGFDCSGFTRYVYGNFGYSLAGVAASQDNVGTAVERDNLQPGDLILFYDEGKTKIGHVGIYMGNGEFIHAANPKRGVVTDNLTTNSYYNERYISSRRIVE